MRAATNNKQPLREFLLGGITFLFSVAPISAVWGACTNLTPTFGQSVTCTIAGPNPETIPVIATPGSTNVAVDVESGASLNITISPSQYAAISVAEASAITNNGFISLTGSGSSGLTRGAGIVGLNNNNILINHGSISTTNQYNDGMAANGSGNILRNFGTITTTGPNSYGMTMSWGQSGGGSPDNTIINEGTVRTSASNARGISILGANGSIVNSGTVSTSGTSAPGVYIQGGNGSLINSGTIHVTGNDTNGVFFNTVATSFNVSMQNLAGGQIISDNGSAVRTLNGTTQIINAGLLSGGNGIALKGGTGNIDLTLRTGSQINGIVEGNTGHNTVTLEGTGLVNNPFTGFQSLSMTGSDWTWAGTGDFHDIHVESGVLRLQASLTGNLTINPGTAIEAGNGFNPMVGPYPGGGTITVVNAGTIDLTNGSSPTRNSLTITGNYMGLNGQIKLKTYLGADNSPSDRLVISGGSATGTTVLDITNAGGPGMLTRGDGILVVQTEDNGVTDPGAFIVQKRLAAGAYDYQLYRGGASGDQDWFLRSTVEILTPAPQLADGFTVVQQPNIRVEVPLAMAIQPIALEYGYAMLGTLHERIGQTWLPKTEADYDERIVSCGKNNATCKTRATLPSEANGEKQSFRTGWARLIGGRVLHQPDNFSRRGPNYDFLLAGIQAGTDLFTRETADGTRDHAGIYAGFGRINANINGALQGKAGSIDLDAYTVGGYWTHYAASGWYTDAVVQGTWYATDAKSSFGERIKSDGFGFAASLEGGYSFKLASGYVLEPQVQVIYQQTSFDNTRDSYASIRLSDTESLRARVGLRGAKTWNMADGMRPRPLTAWLRLNIWHEFMDRSKTTFEGFSGYNPTIFSPSLRGTWGEIGGGITAQISDDIMLFTTGSYSHSLGNKGSQAWDGKLGLTVRW